MEAVTPRYTYLIKIKSVFEKLKIGFLVHRILDVDLAMVKHVAQLPDLLRCRINHCVISLAPVVGVLAVPNFRYSRVCGRYRFMHQTNRLLAVIDLLKARHL